ncbi:MAG: DUF4157 domain-containing protein [Chitinophagaceae bacterium]|nr:DUF4157 domain-containing protein [Chitinophagaceae bacterium]
MKYSIKEKSALAYLASLKLKQRGMAVVWRSTIHLHGVSKADFLANEAWLRHELEHVRQFRQYGLVRFLYLYLLESLRKGYHNNRFEIEARAAEHRAGNND